MRTFLTPGFLKNKLHLPTVIGLVISVSFFSGLNYFYEASQKANFQEFFVDLNDIEIYQEHTVWSEWGNRHCFANTQFNAYFQETDGRINSLIQDSTLDVDQVCKMASLVFEKGYLTVDDYNETECLEEVGILGYLKKMNATSARFGFFETDFYKSDAFNEYIKIIKGRPPKSDFEFLIDYTTALKYNLTVGDLKNITIREGRIYPYATKDHQVNSYLRDFKLSNIKISGIYVPKHYDFNFNLEKFTYSYNLDDFQNEKKYEQEEVEKPVIFCWSNFFLPEWEHPVKNLYLSIANSSVYVHWKWGSSYIDAITSSGYLLLFNHQDLDLNKIKVDSVKLESQIRNISTNLPFGTHIRSYLDFTMRKFIIEIRADRLKLFLINIPTIIFALLVGSNLQKSVEKKRLNELLVLKCKGIPNKLILREFFEEMTRFTAIVWLGGIFLGGLTFFLYYLSLGDIFLNSNYDHFLYPRVTVSTIIFSGLISICETIFIYYPMIKKFKKQHFNSLSQSLNSPFYNSEKKFAEINSKLNLASKMKKEKEINLTGHRFRSKSYSNVTILALFAGIIPLLIISLVTIGFFFKIPDNLYDLVKYFTEHQFMLEMMMIGGMISFSLAISRRVFQDNPSLFTKVVKRFSHIFVKDFDYFISMELLGKKKWQNILIMYATFISTLVCTNFVFQSKFQTFAILFGNKIDVIISDSTESNGFFGFLFQYLLASSVFLILEISIMQMLLYKENHILNQGLMLRGLTNSKLYKILFFECLIIFVFGSVIGFVAGIFFGGIILWNNFNQLKFHNLNYIDEAATFGSILTFEIGKILLIIFLLFFLSVTIFFIYVRKRKKITSHPNEL